MNKRYTLLIVFGLLALVQLSVPAKMIWDKENVLDSGTEFRFRTAPVDPYDPFRGKYITLNFSDNEIATSENEEWERGETVYAHLEVDSEGFAIIKSVSREEPQQGGAYLKTKVDYHSTWGNNHKLELEFPFDRFYMEESKAYEAELSYRDSQKETESTTYALVNIKNGYAVLKDVLIDDVPIKQVVERRLENK